MSPGRLGRYELLAPLGRGGMAEVWRARQRGAASFSREVALKVMLPECASEPDFVTMFVDEACISAGLKHPNIVGTLDFGHVAERYFIVLELIDGVPLRAMLRVHHGLPLRLSHAVFIACEIAAALDYAHAARGADGRELHLVHRDVNPTNVMVTRLGEVKLTDFGIAKTVASSLVTRAGDLKGKLVYMSPEQAWGRPLDARSDIYALGLMLYELLTGRRALHGKHEIDVMESARNAAIALDSPELPPSVAPILRRALAADPAARFPSAGAMREALLPLLEGVRVETIKAGLVELVEMTLSDARFQAERAPPLAPIGAAPNDERAGIESTEVATSPGAPAEASPAGAAPVEPSTDTGRSARRGRPLYAALGLAAATGAGLVGYRAATRLEPTRVSAPAIVDAASVTASPAEIPPTAPPEVALPSSPEEHVLEPARPVRVGGRAAKTAAGSGTVRVRVAPWAQVWVDGKDVGMTPLRPLELATGEHEIVAKHPELGTRRTTVRVASGQSKLVELSYHDGPGSR